jgi:hypothetical protein
MDWGRELRADHSVIGLINQEKERRSVCEPTQMELCTRELEIGKKSRMEERRPDWSDFVKKMDTTQPPSRRA